MLYDWDTVLATIYGDFRLDFHCLNLKVDF